MGIFNVVGVGEEDYQTGVIFIGESPDKGLFWKPRKCTSNPDT